MKAYIVSYLGADPSLIAKRLSIHNRQIEWFKSLDLQIKVFDQNYEDSFRSPGVEYFGYSGAVLKQWKVRNIFLKEFYNSDEDYCIIADNDSILYDHFDGKEFIRAFIQNGKEFSNYGIDAIVPIDAAKSPFNKYVSDRKDAYDSNYVFNPVLFFRTAFFILRNIKKHRKKEIYFRDFSENENLGRADDFFFSHDLNKNGCRCFKTYNIILKDMVGERYSILSQDNEERTRLINQTFEFLQKEYNLEISRRDLTRYLRNKYITYDTVLVPKDFKIKQEEQYFF